MSRSIQTTEGIVLRVIPFRDYDQIATLFTPDLGVIKIVLRKAGGSTKSGRRVCMPLSKVEIAYRESNREIFSCYGMCQLESFLSLRRNFSFLKVGCDLLQVVLDSQFIGKEAADLYALLDYYLKRVAGVANPWVLSSSFRLKVLKHEGFCHFPLRCSMCGEVLLRKTFFERGEVMCEMHRSVGSKQWNSIELQTIYRLAESQSFKEVSQLDLSMKLQEEIACFFSSHYL